MPHDVEATADHLDVSRWDRLEGRFAELTDRPLTADNVMEWLADWSEFSEQVAEGASLLSIRYTQNTDDPARKDAYLHYIREVGPQVRRATHRLKERLLATGFESEELATVLRQFRADVEMFREENVPLLAEEEELASRYGEIIGGLTVEFDGEERTIAALAPYRASRDRSIRESAWRTGHERMLEVRAALSELFLELWSLRRQIAANAGFTSFRDYAWLRRGRFDYSPDDAVTFQRAILEVVVPLLRAQAERRSDLLGLDQLRPWDLEVNPYGGEPLRPFETGDELAEGAIRIFKALDPSLAGYLMEMRDARLLDLENRKGKAPGGYCASLAARRRPFIFMNAVGTEDNVRTMLHEAGHAFHVFERDALPYIWQRRVPPEFAEVASMSMELLTSPYLSRDEGGFYSESDAVRSRIQHLERITSFLPYMAVVDAFQHWLYAQESLTPDDLDRAWLGLHETYVVGADWSGLTETRESLWQHKLHIFEAPFYYIEYGIAQLGALQVWRNSMTDPALALENYRAALALGGSRPLPELFAAAGATLAFDTTRVSRDVGLAEEQAAGLRSRMGPQ